MSIESSIFPLVLWDLSLFLDEILMPWDSPPIMQSAKSGFSTSLCKVLNLCSSPNYARFFLCKSPVFLCTNLCKVLWSKLCLDPRVPGNALRDVWGTL